jgi:hypothetical protein
MYVREKKIKRGIGTWDSPTRVYSYWQVVQGTRVDGKVRQTVLHHIGPADDKDHAERKARCQGFLCAALGCHNRAEVILEGRGFRPSFEIPDVLGGGVREYPYLVCPDHLEAWKRRERFRAMPLLYPKGAGGVKHG